MLARQKEYKEAMTDHFIDFLERTALDFWQKEEDKCRCDKARWEPDEAVFWSELRC